MQKLKAYLILSKIKLSLLVVFSSLLTYLTLANSINITVINALIIGGCFVTISANSLNQLIEQQYDSLMQRTQLRPLPTKQLTNKEVYAFCFIFGVIGITILFYYINILSGWLALLSWILYTLVYTPLKRKTPFAVFHGAFPGAIPTMIGALAASKDTFGYLNFFGILLFLIQFFWQFPHFWAIAWVCYDDYKLAGFNLLPSKNGRDKNSLSQILFYTIILFPIALTPYFFNYITWPTAAIISVTSVYFIIMAIKLYKQAEIKNAKQLMFYSFIYLPIVQITIMVDQLLNKK